MNIIYSGVPNIWGGGVENNREGWEWIDIAIIEGVGTIGGVFGEVENYSFLKPRIFCIFM